MKAVHVVATVDDLTAGPSHSVTQLCRAMLAQGGDVEIHTVAGWRDGEPTSGALRIVRHRQDFPGAPVLGRLCLSYALKAALAQMEPGKTVIHSHGLWLTPNVYPAWAARRTGIATVLSPRGMLGPEALAFSSRKKALFWRLLQGSAVRRTSCLHATSPAEMAEIRAFGILNPVAVIPNGVELLAPRSHAEAKERTVLALGRVHPKKGLPTLIQAWASLPVMVRQGWRLRIVGPSEIGHGDELRALVRTLGLTSVVIEGAVVGEAKARAYGDADLFVLPTLNENFAMTVAEALAAGVPVISTKGAPWAGLEPAGAGWWIDHGPESLASALAQAMALPTGLLQAMGARGRNWMERDFSWERIAREMVQVYAWAAGQGDRPASVVVD